MIVDQLQNWSTYYKSDAWRTAFEFLLSLTPDAEDKKYPLIGDDVFARVMSYETKFSQDAVLEAHRNYIDIQALISGTEGIGWYPLPSLNVKTPYNPEKDVEFYQHPESVPAMVTLTPGIFSLLYPQDAHMPQLTLGSAPERVKKVVIKFKVSLA